MSEQLTLIIAGQPIVLTALTKNPLLELKYKGEDFNLNATDKGGLIMTKKNKVDNQSKKVLSLHQ